MKLNIYFGFIKKKLEKKKEYKQKNMCFFISFSMCIYFLFEIHLEIIDTQKIYKKQKNCNNKKIGGLGRHGINSFMCLECASEKSVVWWLIDFFSCITIKLNGILFNKEIILFFSLSIWVDFYLVK